MINPKEKYFDVQKELEAYERITGDKVNEATMKCFADIGYVINQAYEEGYHDGMERAKA